MSTTWPIIGSYNSIFGEMSVLYGAIFLGAALAIANGWSLATVTAFAFIGGSAAILLGIRIIGLQLTAAPALSGIGFILSGLAGMFAGPTLLYLRGNVPYRMLATLVLLMVAAIWAIIACKGYWMHLESFGGWSPVVVQNPAGS